MRKIPDFHTIDGVLIGEYISTHVHPSDTYSHILTLAEKNFVKIQFGRVRDYIITYEDENGEVRQA